MNSWIALLRGINVSGSKLIKMDFLKSLFLDLGFREVLTYIQSGNVIFKTNQENESELEALLERKIFDSCGFEVPVFCRTPADLQSILALSPFFLDQENSSDSLYFTLLKSKPDQASVEKLLSFSYDLEEIVHADRTIYFRSRIGYGKAKLNNSFIEKKLGLLATTRNFQTIKKLIDLSLS